jgi:uncharacterized protein YndB with AHSA1/START domain
MRIFTHTVHINRAPEVVFDYFTDFSQAARWRQYVKSMEPMAAGPVRAGSRIKVTMTIGGEESEFMLDVMACEPPSTWRHRTNEKHFKGQIEYRFVAEAGGTRVTMSCDVKPATMYGWFGLPLAMMSRGSGYREQLPSLKRVLESDTGAGGIAH